LKLRTRLTIWYSLVLAIVLFVFGVVVYFSVSFNLSRQIEQDLSRTADEILASSRDVPTFELTLRALDFSSTVYAQAWSPDGEFLWRSENMPPIQDPFDPTTLDAMENTFTTRRTDEYSLRVLTVPSISTRDDQVIFYLQLASSLETLDRVRQVLLLVLVGGGVLGVIIAGVVGHFVSSMALRPITTITETALQITRADDLSRRIPAEGPPEGEVGQLVLAFNETLERLQALFETQRRFQADVSHELRTPLTAIRGNVDLIRRMGEADPESLDAITSEVDRMTRMVRDLLAISQAESGKLPIASEVVELDTLMLEVFSQAKLLIQGEIGLSISSEDQARIKGDRDRIKQVMLNLVTNAIDHTPAGGKIELGVKRSEAWAIFSVSDTGTGIPEEHLPHLFERFYRGDKSRKRKASGGAGLGLSIAYWITRAHGGKIEVHSKEGEGSKFEVWLPMLERATGQS
jgi:two-component system OmpR family sensor kinase